MECWRIVTAFQSLEICGFDHDSGSVCRAAADPPAHQRAEWLRACRANIAARCAAGTRRGRRSAPTLPRVGSYNLGFGAFFPRRTIRPQGSDHALELRLELRVVPLPAGEIGGQT